MSYGSAAVNDWSYLPILPILVSFGVLMLMLLYGYCTRWYVLRDGRRIGPLRKADLAQLYFTGQIAPQAPVRQVWDGRWDTAVALEDAPRWFSSAFAWGLLCGPLGLVVGYFVFAQYQGRLINPDILFGDPKNLGEAVLQGLADAVLPIEEIRKRILISGIVGGAFGILVGILVASRPVRLVKGAPLAYDPEQSGDPVVEDRVEPETPIVAPNPPLRPNREVIDVLPVPEPRNLEYRSAGSERLFQASLAAEEKLRQAIRRLLSQGKALEPYQEELRDFGRQHRIPAKRIVQIIGEVKSEQR